MACSGAHLYVGNISSAVDEWWLKDRFMSYGNVTFFRMYPDDDDTCYAFVDFDDIDDAQNAMDVLSGCYIRGCTIWVEWSKQPPNRCGCQSNNSGRPLPLAPQPTYTYAIGQYAYDQVPANFLGRGGFGAVWRGVDKLYDLPVAVKKIERGNRLTSGEVETLRLLNSPYVVKFLSSGCINDQLFIVMELCDGNLQNLLEINGGRLHGVELCNLVANLKWAYGALHQLKVLHRDIKPTNILYKEWQGSINPTLRIFKLADFGCSRRTEAYYDYVSSAIGNRFYIAPEVRFAIDAREAAHYDQRADMFSIGAVIYECVTGRHLMSEGVYQRIWEHQSNFPYDVIDSMRTMLGKRVMAHVDDFKDLLRKMLAVDYQDRIGYQRFSDHAFTMYCSDMMRDQYGLP